MKLKCLILGMILLSATSFAGNERGNGGDAVVCRDTLGKIKSAELLDFYEGKMLRGIIPNKISAIERDSYLKNVVNKLEQFNEAAFKNMRSEVSLLNGAITSFFQYPSSRINNVVFTTDQLTDISDSGELTFRPGCKVEQLAIKVKRIFPHDPSYIIQEDILKSLSETDIAGLVLHEAIYDSFVQNFQAINSIPARYLNQVVTSNFLKNFYFWDYIEFQRAAYPGNDSIIKQGSAFYLPTAKKMSDDSVILEPSVSSDFTYHVAFNKDGIYNGKLTHKWGGIELSPNYRLHSGNWDGTIWKGKLTISVNSAEHFEWDMPIFYLKEKVSMGQWKVKFCFEPYEFELPTAKIDIGLNSLNEIPLFQNILPETNQQKCYERNLNVSLDESLKISIN